jgi:hypothetical protein
MFRCFGSCLVGALLLACGGGEDPAPSGSDLPPSDAQAPLPEAPPAEQTGASGPATPSPSPTDAPSPAPSDDACSRATRCCPKLSDPRFRKNCEEIVASGSADQCAYVNWYYARYCGG